MCTQLTDASLRRSRVGRHDADSVCHRSRRRKRRRRCRRRRRTASKQCRAGAVRFARRKRRLQQELGNLFTAAGDGSECFLRQGRGRLEHVARAARGECAVQLPSLGRLERRLIEVAIVSRQRQVPLESLDEARSGCFLSRVTRQNRRGRKTCETVQRSPHKCNVANNASVRKCKQPKFHSTLICWPSFSDTSW